MTTAATAGPVSLAPSGPCHGGPPRRRGPQHASPARRHRPAFTIVEVLIVIIIIVILAGLLIPAVHSAIVQAKIAATRFEIQSLALALDEYRDDFAIYPPSCVWWEGGRWYTSYSDTRDTMDGAECLVYFLRGPNGRGFTVGDKTFGPYREPKGDALSDVDNDGFQEVQDVFRLGCVYLYFKADRSRPVGSEYNRFHNRQMLDAGGVRADGTRIPRRPGEPVVDPGGRFYCPTTFQIISAGRDARYARSASTYPDEASDPSKDDITNFTSQ